MDAAPQGEHTVQSAIQQYQELVDNAPPENQEALQQMLDGVAERLADPQQLEAIYNFMRSDIGRLMTRHGLLTLGNQLNPEEVPDDQVYFKTPSSLPTDTY